MDREIAENEENDPKLQHDPQLRPWKAKDEGKRRAYLPEPLEFERNR